MSRRLILISSGVVALVCVIWGLHAARVQPPALATRVVLAHFAVPPAEKPVTDNVTMKVQPTELIVDPHEARKRATDYRQLVKLLLPLARAGSASAQYELASALRYCDENWHAHFFGATGILRTPEQMQSIYTKIPENTQSLLKDAGQRCHSFSEDLALLKTSDDWLDQAVTADYPPATFMKADMTMKSHLMDGDTASIERAKQQAIVASISADPEVLFGMADFVDNTNRSQAQVKQLISAWYLLACQSGYDCSAESEAIKSTCTVDPQCADKPTVVEQLQRINGAQFGDVEQLAEQIKSAINSHDPEAIKQYL